jgi:hypothetical protein
MSMSEFSFMTNKEFALGLFRPSAPPGTFKARFRKLLSNLRCLKEAPIGYEDETGFIFGKEPGIKPAGPPAD